MSVKAPPRPVPARKLLAREEWLTVWAEPLTGFLVSSFLISVALHIWKMLYDYFNYKT